MKKLLLSLAALFFAVSLFSQNKDEMAIREVIENQTNADAMCNWAQWESYWWHEDYAHISFTFPKFQFVKKGWSEIEAYYKKSTNSENCTPVENTPNNEKRDFTYVINGDMAYVTAYEGHKDWDVKNEISYVLEKRNGIWKLINLDFVASPSYELEKKKTKLKKFAGEWKSDLNSYTQEPTPKGWHFTSMKNKSVPTSTGLEFNLYNKWTSLFLGDNEYTGKVNVISVFGKKEFTVFSTGFNNFNWSHASIGTAVFEKDNKLVISYFDNLDNSKIVSKVIVEKVNPNTLYIIEKGLDDKGETTWKRKFKMYKEMTGEMVNF